MKLACDWPKMMDGFIEKDSHGMPAPDIKLVDMEEDLPVRGPAGLDPALLKEPHLGFESEGERLATRYAIRDTEISALLGSQIIIVAMPGGNGTFFEYGLAYGLSLSNPESIVIVYSMSPEMIEGDRGHFVGLKKTVVITGEIENLIETIKKVRVALFERRLSRGQK